MKSKGSIKYFSLNSLSARSGKSLARPGGPILLETGSFLLALWDKTDFASSSQPKNNIVLNRKQRGDGDAQDQIVSRGYSRKKLSSAWAEENEREREFSGPPAHPTSAEKRLSGSAKRPRPRAREQAPAGRTLARDTFYCTRPTYIRTYVDQIELCLHPARLARWIADIVAHSS